MFFLVLRWEERKKNSFFDDYGFYIIAIRQIIAIVAIKTDDIQNTMIWYNLKNEVVKKNYSTIERDELINLIVGKIVLHGYQF